MFSLRTTLVSLSILISVSTSFATSLHSAQRIDAISLQQALTDYNNFYCRTTSCSPAEFATKIPDLSLLEGDAIRRYTTGDYVEVNEALRKDQLTDAQVAFVKVLDVALTKLPKVENIKVYRGTTTQYESLVESQISSFPSYASTSIDQSIAEDRFMKDRLMVIEIKFGYDVTSVSQAGQEREVLLPRNFEYYVQSIEDQPREVINEETGERQVMTIQVVNVRQIQR